MIFRSPSPRSMRMAGGLAVAALLAGLAVPAIGQDTVSSDVALSRLRACVTAGAAGAPRESLSAAVVAVRSLCHPQIDAAYRASDRTVAAAHHSASRDDRAARKRQARRQIDFDLAILVSTITGLPS